MAILERSVKGTAVVILFGVFCCLSACSSTPSKVAVKQQLIIPKPPAFFDTPEQRAEFVLMHYWDNFNFSDTTLIGCADYTEQAFSNYVSFLSGAPLPFVDKSVGILMSKAAVCDVAYAHFVELSEKYLYDPNSPLRNEDTYIAVLRTIVDNAELDEIDKIRARHQLKMSLRNRVGDCASDFAYTTGEGKSKRLSETVGDYLLLFFFSPDCPDCKRVKELIVSQNIGNRAVVIMVNPDEVSGIDSLYDTRARPSLYLLDKNKKVLLKDAAIEQVDGFMQRAF